MRALAAQNIFHHRRVIFLISDLWRVIFFFIDTSHFNNLIKKLMPPNFKSAWRRLASTRWG